MTDQVISGRQEEADGRRLQGSNILLFQFSNLRFKYGSEMKLISGWVGGQSGIVGRRGAVFL